MSLLDGLHAVLTVRDAELEGSLAVGLDRLAVGVIHRLPVELERHARHRYARLAVVYVSRIDHILVLVEVVVGQHVVVGVEGHLTAAGEGLAGGRHMDVERAFATVFQSFEFKVTFFVCHHRILGVVQGFRRRVPRLDDHRHARHGGTVRHAHVSADHGGRLALPILDLGPHDVQALTLGDALHHVVVGLLHLHILVLPEILLEVVGDGVGPRCLGVAGVNPSQHPVVVALSPRHTPLQRDAALAFLRGEGVEPGEVHEPVARQLILLHFLHLGLERVGIDTVHRRSVDAHRGVVFQDDEVEVILHTFLGEVVFEVMLLQRVLVFRKVHDGGVGGVLPRHVDAQLQARLRVPDDDGVLVIDQLDGRRHGLPERNPSLAVCGEQLLGAHALSALRPRVVDSEGGGVVAAVVEGELRRRVGPDEVPAVALVGMEALRVEHAVLEADGGVLHGHADETAVVVAGCSCDASVEGAVLEACR